LGETQAGLEELLRAQELAPGDAVIQEGVGIGHFQAGDYRQAEAAFLRSVELDPGHMEGYLWLARVYLRRQEYAKAVEYGEKALALAGPGEAAEVWLVLGRARLAGGDCQAAVRDLRWALEADPGMLEAHMWLGDALVECGDVSGGIVEYRVALAQAEEMPGVDDFLLFQLHFRLGRAYVKKSRFRQGLAEFMLAQEIWPSAEVARVVKRLREMVQ